MQVQVPMQYVAPPGAIPSSFIDLKDPKFDINPKKKEFLVLFPSFLH